MTEQQLLEHFDKLKIQQENEIGRDILDKIEEAISIRKDGIEKVDSIRKYICDHTTLEQKKAIFKHKVARLYVYNYIQEYKFLKNTALEDMPKHADVIESLIADCNINKDEIYDLIIMRFLIP